MGSGRRRQGVVFFAQFLAGKRTITNASHIYFKLILTKTLRIANDNTFFIFYKQTKGLTTNRPYKSKPPANKPTALLLGENK